MDDIIVKQHRTARGGIYIAVLGVTVIVMTLGLGGLLAARAHHGVAVDLRNTMRAQAASVAAVELARLSMAENPSWRTELTSGVWSAPVAFAGTMVSWRVSDPTDGNLADDRSEMVTVEGMASIAGSTQLTAVDLRAVKKPLEVLGFTVHAAGSMDNSGTLSSAGRGISTGGTLTNNGVIRGDASALLMLGTGSISGSTSILSLAPGMPAATVFESYKARATTIPWGGGTGDWAVTWPLLSEGVNPSASGTNSDGIYSISVPASKVLFLELYRIRGTLIIDCADKACVQITKAINWEPTRTDLPILLIRHLTSTYAQDQISPAVGTLSEATLGVNLNPTGSPYQGLANSTLTESYPSKLAGLIHVLFPVGNLGGSSVLVGANASMHGTLLSSGNITVASSGASLTFDDGLYADPPDGYYAGTMEVIRGSWRRIAAP